MTGEGGRKVKDPLPPITDPAPLAKVRGALNDVLLNEQLVDCPCCDQRCKIYRRPIHATMARELISIYKFYPDPQGEFFHLPTLLSPRGGDVLKLSYWGLITPEVGTREDGSGRNGWWRITETGVAFVRGWVSVPRHAVIYAGRLLDLDDTEKVTIQQALGNKFDYDRLMRGEG